MAHVLYRKNSEISRDMSNLAVALILAVFPYFLLFHSLCSTWQSARIRG